MTGTEVKETPRDVLVVCFSAPGRKTGLVSFLFSRSVGDQLAKVLDGLRQDKERLGRWMFDDVCSNLQYPSVISSYHFTLCIHPFQTFSNETEVLGSSSVTSQDGFHIMSLKPVKALGSGGPCSRSELCCFKCLKFSKALFCSDVNSLEKYGGYAEAFGLYPQLVRTFS